MFRQVIKSVHIVSRGTNAGLYASGVFPSKININQFRAFSDSENPQNSSEEKKGTETQEPKKPTDAEIITNLQNEIKQLKDQVLRAYAESENTRRIASKDVENARLYANTGFAKSMIEIADDLERALAAVPPEGKNNADPVLKTLIDGIEMTDKNLQKVFQKFGVTKFGAVDDKFDPNKYEALYRIPDSEKPDTVGKVVKLGYMIKDRVLRPAQVGARVKPDSS